MLFRSNDDWGLRWDAPANALQFYHYNTGNGAGSVYSVAPLILQTWYHIAVSVRSTGYIYLYINGILQNAGGTSISGTPKYTPSSTLWLGSPGNVGWGPSTVYIQDLRIISGGNVPISTFNPSSAPFGNGIPSYTYGMGQTVFSLASQYMTNTISLTSPSLTSSTALATGGDTINIINGNRIHTFTTVGTQTFTVGSNTIQNAQILIVAGGGGGGPISTAAGGGAGGLIYLNSISLSNGSYTVTVGAGGNPGSAGGNSVFGTYTALGGGTAGGGANSPGGNGGSGGGSTNGVAVGSSTQPPSGGNTITISSNKISGGTGTLSFDSDNCLRHYGKDTTTHNQRFATGSLWTNNGDGKNNKLGYVIANWINTSRIYRDGEYNTWNWTERNWD